MSNVLLCIDGPAASALLATEGAASEAVPNPPHYSRGERSYNDQTSDQHGVTKKDGPAASRVRATQTSARKLGADAAASEAVISEDAPPYGADVAHLGVADRLRRFYHELKAFRVWAAENVGGVSGRMADAQCARLVGWIAEDKALLRDIPNGEGMKDGSAAKA